MILVFKERCRQLADEVENLQRKADQITSLQWAEKARQQEAKEALASVLAPMGELGSRIIAHRRRRLDLNAETIDHRFAKEPARYAPWTTPTWSEWLPDGQDMAKKVRVGHVVERTTADTTPVQLPVFIDLIHGEGTLVIDCTEETRDQALAIMHALMLRIACLFPHEVEFTLLDPSGLGQAFPQRRFLPKVRPPAENVTDTLKAVRQDIRRVYEDLLDVHTRSFHELPSAVRSTNRFSFIFAADFPNRYDRNAIEMLHHIHENGPRAGCYLVLHYNESVAFPRDMSIKDFTNVQRLPSSFAGREIILETAPSPDRLEVIVGRLRSSSAPDRMVPWSEIGELPREEWWRGSSDNRVEAPIGRRGSTGTLEIWFGEDRIGRQGPHGMLAARTGMGKSNLYHVLILGLALRYGPKELRLYLIDGKDGVEFEPYRRLPHAEVVSLHSLPELSRSILFELIEEKEHRNMLFKRCGVSDFTGYRAADSPQGYLPRILLLIDEYQELFEGDRHQQASTWLLELVEQGRSTGIHMLLGSQRFGARDMINQSAIFGNINLRMAMGMTHPEIAALSEFAGEGRRLIERCDLPGKIVVNDNEGKDGGNLSGKVAWIGEEEHRRVLDELVDYARQRESDGMVANRVIFDGHDQPRIADNPIIRPLLTRTAWPTDNDLQGLAGAEARDGGWEITSWNQLERPVLCVLGQQFNVRGQMAFALSRRPNHNLAVVGDRLDAAMSLIAGCVVGALATRGPEAIRFDVMDVSSPISPSRAMTSYMEDQLLRPLGYDVHQHDITMDPAAGLAAILEDIDGRQADGHGMQAPARLVLILSPDRARSLRRSDRLSDPSSAGKALLRILDEGPEVGVHTVLFAETVSLLDTVIEMRRCPCILHRVAFEMNETESFKFIGTQAASKVQSAGARPIAALYVNMERATRIRFKPFSPVSDEPITRQIDEVRQQLAHRMGQQQ